jgi:O-antigen ligase
MVSEDAFFSLKVVILQSIVLLLVASMVLEDDDGIIRTMKIMIWGSVFTLLYVLANANYSLIGIERLGQTTVGEEWNANSIGMIASTSLIYVAFIKGYSKYINRKKYRLLTCLTVLFAAVILWSGSRNTLLTTLLALTLFSVFPAKHRTRNVIIFGFLMLFICYSILNVPFLYHLIGYRIDSFLAFFINTGQNIDSSTIHRFDMIERGLDYYKYRPWFGYGINNYQELFGNDTGWYTYSHSNYIELLVGTGLIGIVIYYYIYIVAIRNGIILKTIQAKYSLALIFTMIVADLSTISYINFSWQVMLCISCSVLQRQLNKENEREIT